MKWFVTRLFLLGCFSLLLSALWGQERKKMPFGEIQPSWLEEEVVAEFPDAEAVIVYDFGSITFDQYQRSPAVNYEYRRITKVQTTETNAFREVIISYDPTKELLADIDGFTHSLNAEGEPVRFRINRRRLREEKLPDGRRQQIVEFPLVRPGSVLELRYVLRSRPQQFQHLRSWEFQQAMPVVHSELQAFIPLSFAYQILLGGDVRRLYRESETFTRDQLDQSPVARSLPFAGRQTTTFPRQDFQMNVGRYEIFVMDSLPALVEESFSLNRKDYLPSVRFELERNNAPGSNNANFFESWEDLNDRTSKRFGSRKLKAHKRDVQQLSNTLSRRERGERGDEERIRRILEYVKQEIKWDGTHELTSRRLDKVIASKEANGTEINLLLLHLLQLANIEANPVLISTVENGLVRTYASNLSQFNHLIVSTKLRGVEILLDGLSTVPQMGILPEADLTEVGFLMDEKGGRWVPLRSQNRLVRHTYSRFNLDEGGLLSGKLLVSNQDYSAVLERKRLAEIGSGEAYLRRYVLDELSEVELSNSVVSSSTNPEEPMEITCELLTHDFVRQAGDILFVNPLMTKQVAENPFPDINRTTPMDLTFPLREAHMLGLRIPQGYEIAQFPEPIRVVLPNAGGSFTYNVIPMDSIVHISSTIFLNKTLFLPEEYVAVRSFFEYIVNKHAEDLVLRRVGRKEEGGSNP